MVGATLVGESVYWKNAPLDRHNNVHAGTDQLPARFRYHI